MSFKSNLRGYLDDALRAFDRAPLEVALAVLTAALFSYALETNTMESWTQLAVANFVAFCFAWSATLLHALRTITEKQRWVTSGLGALLGVAYLLFIDTMEPTAEQWRAFMIIVGMALLVFSVPAWYRGEESASLRLRRINGRFVLRAAGIYLYGLALFGGLALALSAINRLFELDLAGEIYGHVFGWIMLVLVPWVVVGGLHDYIGPLDEQSDVARVVQRLASFLIPPLLVLYYIILYVYAARIALTGELPKNLVSPMVIAAGLLAALALTTFDPLADDGRAGARLLRWAPPLFIPLIPLGFWALGARIGEYGWTEFRLLRVLVLVLLSTMAVLAAYQVWRRRPFSLRVFPVVLAAVLLLGAVGPWNILGIARADQQARLRWALREAQVDVDQPVLADAQPRLVSRDLYERISSGGAYLYRHFGESALRGVTHRHVINDRWAWSLAEYFGLTPALADTVAEHFYGQAPSTAVVAVTNAVAYRITMGGRTTADAARLTIALPEETLYVDLLPIIPALPAGRRRAPDLIGQSVIARNAAQQARGDLIIMQLSAQRSRDSLKITNLDAWLLYPQRRQP